MERSEKTEVRWWAVGEVKGREQQGHSQEELDVSHTDDEEDEGCPPIITACREDLTEVVRRLLESGADVTLCNSSQETALHVSPPELQGQVLGWMSRSHLSPQAQLLQASWQGDLHTLQHLLDRADGWDVNVPNSDGVTAVMLAVRDVDLFQSIRAQLPWDHRPIEVVEKLIGYSADLQVRDHSGCCALYYAANICSPLREEIIHVMVEALSHTDATDKYSCQDVDTEFEDSDIELDIENLRPHQSTPPHTPQQHCVLSSRNREVLESPLSDQHKDLSQDKIIPLYFQNTMETLGDIRQAYQDPKRESRRGLSLPSLKNNSRCGGREDPAPTCVLLCTRTPCIPVPPIQRQRTRSVVTASSVSPCGLLSVAEPSQLSQSAPSIMEPLLSSNTMMQARAHVQTRLGSQDVVDEQKGSLLAPPLRTPKLLAPLDIRPRDTAALPVLKHHVPLKPISRSPLCSRAWLRRERLSRCSSRTGPLTTAKGGSEESGSSSSQSSVDLEDEEIDLQEVGSEDNDFNFVEERLLQRLTDISCTHADLDEEKRRTSEVQLRITRTTLSHRSAHNLAREPLSGADDFLSTSGAIYSHCEGKATMLNNTQVPNNRSFKRFNCTKQAEDTVNSEMPVMHDANNGIIFETNEKDDVTARPGIIYRNELQHVQQTEVKRTDSCDERTQDISSILHSAKHAELNLSSDGGKIQHPTIKLPMSSLDSTTDKKMVKALKPAQSKETINHNELRADNQTNQFIKHRALKHRSSGSRTKSKSNLKSFPVLSSLSTQAKEKTRESPELIVSVEATVKGKPKLNSVKGVHRSTDTPPVRKKVVDHPQSKRTHSDKSNNGRAQPPLRDPTSARQSKRHGLAETQRSKSAVDFITYNDMFQQIQSREEGPAIYEMFAGPIYDNLRVSSSCEKADTNTNKRGRKDRQVQSALSRKVQQSHKVKHRPMKHPQCKVRRTPGESMAAKSKERLASSKAKAHLPSSSRKDNAPEVEAELRVFSKHIGISHNSAEERAEDHNLSTIEETLSRYDLFRSSDKTLTMPILSSHVEESHVATSMQEVSGTSTTGNQSRPVPEPVVPQSSQQLKVNMWTSPSSSSSRNTVMSPVYQRFLDEVGDGPLTDDLLQCLAEELISLDERDVSISLYQENMESSGKDSNRDDHATGRNKFPEIAALLGSAVASDDISWTKGEVLGRGAYGTVYCGLTSQGQLIAVKQVTLDTSDPDAAQREYCRLQEEVELLKTLRHINIVGFLGTSLSEHMVSIFMEYIPGGSISSILHRFGPLPERVLALYTHQILEGVAFLHMNRVIHRDLKGNNVMLMPTGVIKLIDFGCARRLSCLNHTASNSGDLLKSVHGTPFWMAPEVINETGYGRKSDIWSVGCTVFEMATGKPPLAHMDKMAALFYIGARRGLMPTLPERFSEHARDFVQICLTSDQQLRPSAAQLLKHSFISRNEAEGNSWKTRAKNCCGHPKGQCG